MPFVNLSELESTDIDYVVIGGGTTGLTLASRLSEIPAITVLVIEAGSYHGYDPEIDIPGMLGRTVGNPKYDWSFLSVPQKHANNRVIPHPRGKGLGGSSLINFMGMFHPSKSECDALERLGNKGWNWDSLLHYMKKSETTIPTNVLSEEQAKQFATAKHPDPRYYGTEGPILKSVLRGWTDAHARFLAAAETRGIPRNPETGAGINIGGISTYSSVDPRTATRSYAVTAYMQPNIWRRNFLVLTDTQVTRVMFGDQTSSPLRQATGVELLRDGTICRIGPVRRDIILSAGTYKTPHLLELSGIGNSEILGQHNVQCVVDLPGVGENLQDHIAVATIAEIENGDETFDVMRDPALYKKHEELYKQHQGHLAYGPISAHIFLSAKQLGTSEDISSWECQADSAFTESLAKAMPSLKPGLEKQYSLQRQFIEDNAQAVAEVLQYLGHPQVPNSAPIPGKKYTRLSGALMHPLSRGSVHLASPDPLVDPNIDPNYLSNEADLDLLVHIVRFVLQFYDTPPLRDIVKSVVLPREAELKSDASLEEYIKQFFIPVYHPVGTAAMLPRDDGGVVDEDLKVYGTFNLRVADLSILPLELSCHTQSVAYAIGEKVADMLKNECLQG
ncbi:alcohol oxidase [Fomitiporia mediterranea MF3/22]|uniref:alcohol oxidase n=1 Tax=Fomitiporia mediterranea (strain MF3/22) TaxID=694068 RepID=UPI0004409586|nr:alcohol oxidase [Fomitiporia mediterranea MF3/22]EJD00188.1 alcohol oxidase [Fomitiporia mediterranea MF3/22]